MTDTARDWSVNFDAVKRRVQAKRANGEMFTSLEVKNILSTIESLDQQLKTMSAAPLQYEVAMSELARRQVVLDNLRRHVSGSGVINTSFSTSFPSSSGSTSGSAGSASAAAAAIAAGPGSVSSSSSSSSSSASSSSSKSLTASPLYPVASATYSPLNTTSSHGLIQRQQEVIKIQDEMLLDIGKGVERLHQQALTIGDEAKLSSRLLDDLDGNVEMATAALHAEAKHAERIKEKARVCWMYVCIAAEIVVIVILLVLAFGR